MPKKKPRLVLTLARVQARLEMVLLAEAHTSPPPPLATGPRFFGKGKHDSLGKECARERTTKKPRQREKCEIHVLEGAGQARI